MNHHDAEIDALLKRHHHAPHPLVQVLREVQAVQHWISRSALGQIADALHLPLAHVEVGAVKRL